MLQLRKRAIGGRDAARNVRLFAWVCLLRSSPRRETRQHKQHQKSRHPDFHASHTKFSFSRRCSGASRLQISRTHDRFVSKVEIGNSRLVLAALVFMAGRTSPGEPAEYSILKAVVSAGRSGGSTCSMFMSV